MKNFTFLIIGILLSIHSIAQQFRGGNGDGASSRGNSGGFTIVTPLPIELLEFTAKVAGEKVKLNWTTATETNNDFFTIQRSFDGQSFEVIKRLQGAGTSTSVKKYEAYDFAPLKGVSYYRLKQTDYDGTSVDSKSIAVKISSPGTIIISRNPTNGNYLLDFKTEAVSEGNYTINITNSFGQIVLKESLVNFVGSYVRDYDFMSFGKGVYIVSISSAYDQIVKRVVAY